MGDAAAAVLDGLLAADVIERALILGWDVRELVGIWRFKPHDHPLHAGLIFSVRAGDRIAAVFENGCSIECDESNVRHIWRRLPIPDDGSIILPWQLIHSLQRGRS